jgi:hypothetical protein
LYNRGGHLGACDAPDDESFSSQPDDFESSNEYQKLETSSSISSQDKTQEMEKILNQSSMSESLLYCLDGNPITASPSSTKKRRRQMDDEDDLLKENSSTESFKRALIESDSTEL